MRSLLLAAALSLVACSAQPPLPKLGHVPSFSLVNEQGKSFSSSALRGKVWVAHAMFTHCPAICPMLTQQLRQVQQHLLPIAASLHFVSLSIDPQRDTPARLHAYAAEQKIDRRNWTLLTGEPRAISALVTRGLRLGDARRVGQGDGNLLHSTYYVLVDAQGSIRGFYRSEAERVAALEQDIKRLVQQATPKAIWRGRIAMLNATLNGTAGLLLVAGTLAIRRRQRSSHRRWMTAALVVSSIFLVSYLTRRFAFGDTPYLGFGWRRPLYFTLLITHVLLAISVVPLALRTFYLGNLAYEQPERVAAHRRIAKITLPIWLYVSVTGVVVYLMLY